MARTRSTARKSRDPKNRAALRSQSLASSLSSSLPPGTVAPDLLTLLVNWLAALLSALLSALASRILKSNARCLDWFPLLRALCASQVPPPPQVVRTIVASLDGAGDTCEQERSERSLLLQTAVLAYIERHCGVFTAEQMHYELVAAVKSSSNALSRGDCSDNQDDGSGLCAGTGDCDGFDDGGFTADGSNGGCYASNLAPQLVRPMNQWLHLTPEIEFQHACSGSAMHLLFRAATSRAIDAFIECAFAEYERREAQRLRAATERFHYERIASGASQQRMGGVAGGSRTRVRRRGRGRRAVATRPQTVQICKRYRLADTTTFGNLFFDDKPRLLQTLDDFDRRAGKFAPRRFAHRLGIFVHGPSGSGKTSVAKAVAHRARRHIVNIQASSIKTNREAADLLQDLNYTVPGLSESGSGTSTDSTTVELAFQDVVLVLEGIDEIVFAQPSSSSSASWSSRYEGISSAGADAITAAGGSSDDKSDRLTVHGLLAALDGMVDTPRRMIVMTARDCSRVHPALVRPGRVHCAVDLRRMSLRCTQQMLEYYLATQLDDVQLARLQLLCTRHDNGKGASVSGGDSDRNSGDHVGGDDKRAGGIGDHAGDSGSVASHGDHVDGGGDKNGGVRGDDGIGATALRACWTAAELEALCFESDDVDAVLRGLAACAGG